MEHIKKLIKLIDKYHKLIEKEDFEAIEKICPDGDIVSACVKLAGEAGMRVGMKYFETKGFDSSGYDLKSYVFVWIEDGVIDGKVLDVESF